jgi:hypothetical protein
MQNKREIVVCAVDIGAPVAHNDGVRRRSLTSHLETVEPRKGWGQSPDGSRDHHLMGVQDGFGRCTHRYHSHSCRTCSGPPLVYRIYTPADMGTPNAASHYVDGCP